ncbi:MAG: hypothetical protein ACK5NG_06845, partial [Chthoniobacterales bacterium]
MEADFEYKKVAENIRGSEGPCTTEDGRIFMVEPGKGSILEIVDGVPVERANTGGIPAGLQTSADQRIWIADMKLGILSMELDGSDLRSEVSEYEGEKIRGCNDLYFDSVG